MRTLLKNAVLLVVLISMTQAREQHSPGGRSGAHPGRWLDEL